MIERKQTKTIKAICDYIDLCPWPITISSMSGGFVHIKVMIDETVDVEKRGDNE